mmetsp:Transcript_25513/g.28344  ORF Transcript_25513/g.28344 Transcript_25513/m.28344 type:complete len:204 (-) Transcript_25513:278-889(-)
MADKPEDVAPAVEDEKEKGPHPLQWQWTMYYNPPHNHKRNPGAKWTSNVREVVSFDTIEDFWRLFNNLEPPSKLAPGSNYHLFKKGIKPEWEHVCNSEGGKWIISMSRKEDVRLDSSWMNLVLAMIGEHFEDSEDICGLVISPRQSSSKLALWTKTACAEKIQMSIGRAFKGLTDGKDQLTYQVHADALTSRQSFKNKPKYLL